MPKIDLQYSHGALPAASLGPLTDELATLLLRHRGLAVNDENRAKVWAFAQEQPAFVAGAAPALPLVVATIGLIEGGLDAAAAAALIAEGTEQDQGDRAGGARLARRRRDPERALGRRGESVLTAPAPQGAMIRRLLLALASSEPSAVRTSPSANATRRPGFVTQPWAWISPVSAWTGRR